MENPHVSPVPNIVDLEDDDHLSSFITPISCRGSSKTNAISVDQYTDVRDLHFSTMASLLPKSPPHPVINLDDYDDDDDDVKVLNFKPSATPPSPFGSRRKRRKPLSSSLYAIEIGQSSSSKTDTTPQPQEAQPFMCEICVEPKPMNESFNIKGCTHSYCTNCMIKYIASKLQDNVTSIRCPVPNCPGLLDPEYCRGILPQEVFDRWGNALCESVLLASEKFYCPFKDCSALLLHDEGGGGGGGEVVTQSECPNCKRMFCVQCKAGWHSGMGCEEFRKLNKDEREKEAIMLKELANKKSWKRCPKCRFYVEKKLGCDSMRCRCGFYFCYKCGNPLVPGDHYHNLHCAGIGRTTPMAWTPPPMVRALSMGRTPTMGGTLRPMGRPLPMGGKSRPMGRAPTMAGTSGSMGRPPTMAGTSRPIGWTPTMGRTSHPMGRTSTMGGTSRPMGRTPSMAGTSRPMGRTPTMGGTSHPMGRTPTMGRTSRPMGRAPTMVGTSRPMGRTLTMAGTSHPMGRPLPMGGKSRPMGGTSRPIGRTLTMAGTSCPMGRTTTTGGTSRSMGRPLLMGGKSRPMGLTPKLKSEKK